MTADIAHVIEEIKKESALRRTLPPHPDRESLKAKKVRIRPAKTPLPERIYGTLKREKLRVFRRFYKVPILGYCLRWAIALLRLPIRLERLYDEIIRILSRLDHVEPQLRILGADVSALENKFSSFQHSSQLEIKEAVRRLEDFEKVIRAQAAVVQDAKNQLRSMQFHGSSPTTVKPVTSPGLPDHSLDNFYVAFENRFRGSNEQIREKLMGYLPYLKESDLDFSQDPVLDIGCGRGEWLTLLREQGYRAIGVDMNEIMITVCKDQNLEVSVSDGYSFLKAQANESLGAITGFHVVEHIPFRGLVALIDECMRVLKPGGIVIFETPNPENAVVGSCNFYIDPTHINPIPPPTMAFFLEERGFHKYVVRRMNPVPRTKTYDDPIMEDIVSRFHKEQDYAIIAYKF